MSRLKQLIHEVHRRSLWQVLAIYVVGSWIVLQVIDVLAQNMSLPPWTFPFAIVLLLIGLPIVLGTASAAIPAATIPPSKNFKLLIHSS